MTKPLPEYRVLPVKHKAHVYCVIISKDDWRKVKKHAWHIHHSAGSGKRVGQPYVRANVGKKKVYLHRYITGCDDTLMHVDHRNRQTLDCRRENLEVVTHEENMKRRRKLRKRVVDKKQITFTLPHLQPENHSISFAERLRP